jgi:hypothetical protein
MIPIRSFRIVEKGVRRVDGVLIVVDLRVPLNTEVQVPVGKHLFIAIYLGCSTCGVEL